MSDFIAIGAIIVSFASPIIGYILIRRKVDAETEEKKAASRKTDTETLVLYQDMVSKEAKDNSELRRAIADLSKCQAVMEEKVETMDDEIKKLNDLLAIKDTEIANLKMRLRITESDNVQLRDKIEKLEARQS